MSRKEERVKAFEIIYQNLFVSKDNLFEEESNLSDFTMLLVSTVENHKEELLKDIKQFSNKSIYFVDLAIILLAMAEIKYEITPKEVAVNEAVEIAKIYSTDDSPSFVNGFLKAMTENGK